MDDLSGKLGEILSDPAAMAKIQSLAQTLGLDGGGQQGEPRAAPRESSGQKPASGDSGLLSALSGLLGTNGGGQPGNDTAQALLRMAPLLGGLREETDGTRLLRALRPLLSPARQARLDQAVRLLQLMRVLPLLRQSGLF